MAAPRVVNARPARAKGESKPREYILKDGTIESVAEFINNGSAKNIIVMSGAGISTAAGIKDFRSPGTGLYDDLERFNLPYPEAVFDISFFKDNPDPFYRLAKELLPGRYRPTFTHYLLPLLAKKGLLLRSYTQNIDMLERLTGLDEELLVEAHGSFATSECIECNELCDNAIVRKHILKGDIPHCKKCKGLVKPTITFFGENLPDRFGIHAQVGELQAMFEAGNIEMALAEELEALTLAKEEEEEKKEIEERAQAEKDNANNNKEPQVQVGDENILRDIHEGHHIPRESVQEEEKERVNAASAAGAAGAAMSASSEDVDDLTDRLRAAGISSSSENNTNKSS
ncbi:NAD-dependent protein deacetylase sirtuin-2 [Linnemannia exigua]|uniref:NAD-dependent protein deacetylase sirtuin-2 n=1 Tax=Linnemannia exigua TaxID=604196 RepID=A0AAD4D9L8_9FUNG|nr:NAD-dependent protein deacetylase sirtuin-2 [Linnemannia exigua]